METGNRVRPSLQVHDGEINCLTFSADAQIAVMGDSGGSVRVWDIARGERIGGDLPAHRTVTDLTLTPDKKLLITGGDDGEVKVWDLAQRQLLHTIAAHKQKIVGFAMSSDGRRFATAGKEQEIKLWDLTSAKELRKWSGVAVQALAFTPDGKHLATANQNTTLYLLECP
jgi:WD40 repeat protein